MLIEARQVFDKADLADVGTRMAARKESVQAALNIP